MSLKLITAPTQDPVALNEMKSYLRVDDSMNDTTISTLIKVAREACQNYQNRAYYTQTWELTLDDFPHIQINMGRSHYHIPGCLIPLPPLQSIVSIKYYDTANKEYTIDSSSYYVDTDSEPGRVILNDGVLWPSVSLRKTGAVKIRFIAGYIDITKAPNAVKLAYMLYVSWYFDHPDAEQPPQAFYYLLDPERLVPV